MAVNARTSKWTPWAALIAGIAAEVAHHQVLSDMLRFDCRLGGALAGGLGALAALALIAVGIAVSLASVRGLHTDDAHGRNRRFIARLSIWTAALLAVAVLWQTLATVIVPDCAR